jgi:hypothetical protein
MYSGPGIKYPHIQRFYFLVLYIGWDLKVAKADDQILFTSHTTSDITIEILALYSMAPETC